MPEPVEAFLSARLEAAAGAVAALTAPEHHAPLVAVAGAVAEAARRGSTVFFCGNGGSAADASHLAAEFVGRCTVERDPLPAVALADSAAVTTALANDYGYDQVFVRQLRAIGRAGDVLVALSTSGRSSNVLAALVAARDLGLVTVGLTGGDAGGMPPLCDHLLVAPSAETPRIQECHQVWGHVLTEWVDHLLS